VNVRPSPQHHFPPSVITGCRVLRVSPSEGQRRRLFAVRYEVAERPGGPLRGRPRSVQQGGIDPELPVTGLCRSVARRQGPVPSMHVTRFLRWRFPMGFPRRVRSQRECLISFREAFWAPSRSAPKILETTCAGCFFSPRAVCRALWVEIVTTAHGWGCGRSYEPYVRPRRHPKHGNRSSTCCAAIQDRTGCFTESSRCRSCTQDFATVSAAAATSHGPHRDNPPCTRWPESCCRPHLPHSDPWEARPSARSECSRRSQRPGRHADGETHLAMAGSGAGSAQDLRLADRDFRIIGRPSAPAPHQTYGPCPAYPLPDGACRSRRHAADVALSTIRGVYHG